MDRDFSNDVAFLEKHVDVIMLSSDESLAMVAVVPQYQGRVIEVYQRVGALCREGADESYIRKRHRALEHDLAMKCGLSTDLWAK